MEQASCTEGGGTPDPLQTLGVTLITPNASATPNNNVLGTLQITSNDGGLRHMFRDLFVDLKAEIAANNKVVENSIQSLNDKLEVSIKSLKAELKVDIKNTLDEFKSEFKAEIAEQFSNFKAELNIKVDTVENECKTDIREVRSALNNTIERVELIKQECKVDQNILQSTVGTLTADFNAFKESSSLDIDNLEERTISKISEVLDVQTELQQQNIQYKTDISAAMQQCQSVVSDVDTLKSDVLVVNSTLSDSLTEFKAYKVKCNSEIGSLSSAVKHNKELIVDHREKTANQLVEIKEGCKQRIEVLNTRHKDFLEQHINSCKLLMNTHVNQLSETISNISASCSDTGKRADHNFNILKTELNSQITSFHDTINVIKTDTSALRNNVSTIDTHLRKQDNQIKSVQSSIEQINNSNKSSVENYTRVENNVHELNTKVEKINKTVQDHDTSIATTKANLLEATQRITDNQTECQNKLSQFEDKYNKDVKVFKESIETEKDAVYQIKESSLAISLKLKKEQQSLVDSVNQILGIVNNYSQMHGALQQTVAEVVRKQEASSTQEQAKWPDINDLANQLVGAITDMISPYKPDLENIKETLDKHSSDLDELYNIINNVDNGYENNDDPQDPNSDTWCDVPKSPADNNYNTSFRNDRSNAYSGNFPQSNFSQRNTDHFSSSDEQYTRGKVKYKNNEGYHDQQHDSQKFRPAHSIQDYHKPRKKAQGVEAGSDDYQHLGYQNFTPKVVDYHNNDHRNDITPQVPDSKFLHDRSQNKVVYNDHLSGLPPELNLNKQM